MVHKRNVEHGSHIFDFAGKVFVSIAGGKLPGRMVVDVMESFA